MNDLSMHRDSMQGHCRRMSLYYDDKGDGSLGEIVPRLRLVYRGAQRKLMYRKYELWGRWTVRGRGGSG